MRPHLVAVELLLLATSLPFFAHAQDITRTTHGLAAAAIVKVDTTRESDSTVTVDRFGTPSQRDEEAGRVRITDSLTPRVAESGSIVSEPFLPAEESSPATTQFEQLEGERQPIELAQEVRPLAPVPALTPIRDVEPQLAPARFRRYVAGSSSLIIGSDARTNVASDAGSLLGKSSAALGVGVQKRTPIVTDPRVRGSQVGQLLASGSFWVPARIDIDTLLSKIDSRIVSDMTIIKGPFSVRHGPGFDFIDVELLAAPRYENGYESHGSSSIEYQTNGEQWYGRQSLFGGSDNWGYRVGYGHRTGSDYETGDGFELPTSYKSRDLDVALGADLSEDSHLEFSYLRLDQTDVEFPGQILDINFLVTDAYELNYLLEDQVYFDALSVTTWYNRTRFEGDNFRSGKRRQIPTLDAVGVFAETDVDSTSTGFRLNTTWGQPDEPQLTVGVDLRYVEQELNELADFNLDFTPIGIPVVVPFADVNSPIPRSHASNPGLLADVVLPVNDQLVVSGGARVDWVSTELEGDLKGLDSNLGVDFSMDPPIFNDQRPLTRSGLADTFGVEDFGRDFNLWAAHITAAYQVDECVSLSGGVGTAERPPTLTELYAAGPVLAILQQGFTALYGDPDLDPSQIWQIDLNLNADYGRFRGSMSGFYAWVKDYITIEAIAQLDQTLSEQAIVGQFMNTELATLSGAELSGEFDLNNCLTTFATMSYVEGRDLRRSENGKANGMTVPVNTPRDPNTPRGLFGGADHEPLPGIIPLESRLGVRLHDPCENRRWYVDFSARVVDAQDRVASSLLEFPTAGFTTYDLRSFWRVTDQYTFIAGVENLTDKHYREHLDLRTGRGVFQPGVNFYFGSELTY